MASTPDQAGHPLDKRITELREKLRAREGQPAYAQNCQHIRNEIERLEMHRLNAENQ